MSGSEDTGRCTPGANVEKKIAELSARIEELEKQQEMAIEVVMKRDGQLEATERHVRKLEDMLGRAGVEVDIWEGG